MWIQAENLYEGRLVVTISETEIPHLHPDSISPRSQERQFSLQSSGDGMVYF